LPKLLLRQLLEVLNPNIDLFFFLHVPFNKLFLNIKLSEVPSMPAEDPLPDGWEAKLTDDVVINLFVSSCDFIMFLLKGKTYYWAAALAQSTWERPTSPVKVSS
jgi:hypothetical protein